MGDFVDEYAVHQLSEIDEAKLKPKTKMGFHLGEKDAKITLEELEIVSRPSKRLMQEALGDKSDPSV